MSERHHKAGQAIAAQREGFAAAIVARQYELQPELWKPFGSKRLIYGSNWPCTKKTGDYKSFVRVVHGYFSRKGQDACDRYYWKNAAEAYNLNL